MVFPKFVLDSGRRAQRTKFAAPDGDISRACAATDFRPDVEVKPPKPENLASWENEGGASAPGLNVVQPVAGPARAAHATKYPNLSEGAPRGANNWASDTNMLAIMRVSLLLLIPAIGGGAIYWGLLIGGAPQ
jgi:hypothetical protein